MLKYLVEFIGTFIFLGVILNVVNQKVKWAAFGVGLALAVVVLWGGGISGGHFNPAVSVMFFLNKQLSIVDLVGYIVAQILGGAAALLFINSA
jgi:aquaporin Z|tara:strand:- start:177 stop:455 length:279 start_codon:yes stop_codon:yes gene_type:complete